jgi:uncharacterized SAM-binding protein YcdF (DUF218 family)
VSRVLVVLGYSDGSTTGLHPVCAARLDHAALLSGPDDVVVLSGWARDGGRRSEAELMRAAWRGAAREVVVDPDARTTYDNARNALDDVARAQATEIVVVTSSWHARRARTTFRWLLRGSGIDVRSSSPEGRSARGTARELVVWPLIVGQLAASRRRLTADR